MNTPREISNSDDIIDVRDVIARVEHLGEDESEPGELSALVALLDELKGYGGDEQWRGDWYPVTLIRDSYFKQYAMQLADDVGAINAEATWPNNCIDWDRATSELQCDYSAVDFDGITYWYR